VRALRSRPRLWLGARLLGLAAVCAAGAAAAVALLHTPSASHARVGTPPRGPLESMFQDDQLLIDSPTPTVTRTLDELRGLGVERLRLTVLWSAIAPDPLSARPPAGFDASQPAAYPVTGWAPFDRVLRLARARGIGVDFDLTAPGPRWAMAPRAPVAAQASHYAPSARAFGAFVRAVGRRYSGSYRPPGAAAPLPRVGFWSIWNEPNQPGWLAPQWQTRGATPAIASARLYRGYVDAATAALDRTGHGRDTVLIGELAPEGDERPGESAPVPPLPFLRALYCVGPTYAPLRGDAAAALGCPAGGRHATFVAAHPGLFAASGFAHHPYSFFLAPARSMSDPNFAPLADLSRLEQGLDRIFASYAVSRRLPLYLTEYGYETNPPNPYRGVAPATQAAYLDEAEYLAWLDPRVRALSQFELRDSAPNRAFRAGTVRYWSTFQTGLEYLDGRAKPSLAAYALPIFIPDPRFAPGATAGVWAMLRAAANGTDQRAQVQWRPPHGAWRTLAVARTHDAGGVLLSAVRPPGSGLIRVAWAAPSGRQVVSRSVPVTG
jgi:hypothetical protein